jgi:multidrug efflux pump
MMCARLLRGHDDERHGVFYRTSENGFAIILRGYEKSRSWVLEHQPVTLLVTVATIGISVYLYVIVPKGFFPQQDTGRMTGQIRPDEANSFQAMQDRVVQVVRTVMQDPAIAGLNAYVGGGNGYSTARMFVTLQPLAERKLSADQVIARLRPRLARIPGAALVLQSVQDVRIGGRGSAAQYQYTLQSDNVRT